MGIDAGVGNKDMVNGQKATWRSDLVNNTTGERIDVESRNDPRLIPQQIFTNVYPDQRTYPSDARGRRQMNNDIERMIKKEAFDNNMNIREATESLLDKGILGPSKPEDRHYAIGKGIKAFPGNVKSKEDLMEKILMPEYNRGQEGLLSKASMPPQSVLMVDPKLAMEKQETITKNIQPGHWSQGPLRVRPSNGDVDSRQGVAGHARGRVYVDLPVRTKVNGKQIGTDVSKTHPLVQQILATGFDKLPSTPF
jgi:hypothetical protein